MENIVKIIPHDFAGEHTERTEIWVEAPYIPRIGEHVKTKHGTLRVFAVQHENRPNGFTVEVHVR